MTFREWITVVACVVLTTGMVGAVGEAGAAIPGEEGPAVILHIDLREFGYEEKRPWQETLNRFSLAFTSKATLALTYRVRDDRRLNAVFFPIGSSEARTSHVWPEATELLPTHDGRFVVRDKSGLTLYSPALEALNRITLDCSQQRFGNWCFDPWRSPDSRSIFIHQGTKQAFTLRMLDADTLREVGSWVSQGEFLTPWRTGRTSIGEHQIAAIENDFHPKALYVHELNKPWPSRSGSRFVVVADPNWQEIHRAKKGSIGSPTFIANDLIALIGSGRVVVVSIDGIVSFEDRPVHGMEYLIPEISHSSDKQRFAVRVATQWLNFSHFPSVHRYTRVVVYDATERKAIFKVKHKPTWSEEIAISPEGSLLAVLHGSAIDVYQVDGSPRQIPGR